MEAAGKRYIIHNSKKDEFTIWNLADLHWWNKACDVKGIKRDIRTIQNDPFSFWVGGGDYADYIGYTDKRFDPDCVPDRIKVEDLGKSGKVQVSEIKDLFSPIKDKCLGLLLGNHEKKYQTEKEQSHLHAWLCTELGVPNLEYSALFDLIFARGKGSRIPELMNESPEDNDRRESQSFRFYVHHGAGFAQTSGGKLNRLIQFMESFDADIYMVAHVHDQVGRRQSTIGANTTCTELTHKEKIGVISGSYLKTYAQGVTTYGEQRGYKPTHLGSATISIVPFTRTLKGEI